MEDGLKQNDNIQASKIDETANNEHSDFFDDIMKENIGLKRQLILNEIDIQKYKEMLISACSKYYNLESGNMNETDRIYFEAIRKIKMEHEDKLEDINKKYNKETDKLISEHNEMITKIKKFGVDILDNPNNHNNDNNNNIGIAQGQTLNIESIQEKLDLYDKKLKTLQEELFNSEKYAQILQMKYESLLQENDYLKKKIPEEKEILMELIEDLKRNQKDNFDRINNTFHKNCDLITETYSSFCSNEKNKENVLMDSLLIEKDTLDEQIKELSEENQKLKSENQTLLNENKKNDDFISTKIMEISTIKGLKENYNLELKNYQDEICKLKGENVDLKKSNSEHLIQIANLEKKVKNVQETIETEMTKLNEKNSKIIDDLNNQILELDIQKRELTFNLEQTTKNYNARIEKIKKAMDENERLKQTVNEMTFKVTELESMNNTLNNQLLNYQKDYQNLLQKNETVNKMIDECNKIKEKDKVSYANLEKNYNKLQAENNNLEQEKNKLQIELDNLTNLNTKNKQNYEKEKLNSEVEIKKLHKTLEAYERKLNSNDSNFTFQLQSDSKTSIQKIYQVYTTKMKKNNSLSYTDENKMLKDMELNFENDLDSLVNSQNKSIKFNDGDELQKYKKKMALIKEIVETALQKNEQNPSYYNQTGPVTLINNLEKNKQLTKFYENLLIHIQSTNLLHLLQIFKLNCDNEQTMLVYLKNNENSLEGTSKFEKQFKKVTSLQNQFDTMNNKINETIQDLKNRGQSYIMLDDFVKVQKIFEESLTQITNHMFSSLQQYISKQIINDEQYVIFKIPANSYNYLLEQIETFSTQSIEQGREIIHEKVEQGNSVIQAIDAIYYITSNPVNAELINRIIKEKFI